MKSIRLVMLASLMALGAPLFGQTQGPIYPPPGGNTFVASGSGPLTTGGETWTYSGFNPSDYGQLWWGEVSISNPCQVGCDGSLMSLASYNPATGVAIYDSTEDLTFFSGDLGHDVFTATEFVLTITPNPGSSALEPNPAGFPGNPALVVPVDPTGSLSVNFEYEVPGGESLANYFAGLNGGGGLQTSSTAGFWYVTPEPASFLLMGTGFLGLAGFFRRRIFGV